MARYITTQEEPNLHVHLHLIPPKLANFTPLPEQSDIFQLKFNEEIKRASFPWEQIDRMWVLHQHHYDMKHGLDFKMREIQFGRNPVVYVGCLCALNVVPGDQMSRGLLSRSTTCPNMTLARQIVASQALLYLAPQYARQIARENVSNRLVYLRPLDTRDNLFDLNGETMMEQAMELLTAADAVRESRRGEKEEEIMRYNNPAANWMDYEAQDKTLTPAYQALVRAKRVCERSPEKTVFQWALRNVGGEPVPGSQHARVEFVVLKGGEVFASATSSEEEPVTRVIYRGLVTAARVLHCSNLVEEMWREFALTLSPPLMNAAHEYMQYYFDAFFGQHNTEEKTADPVLPRDAPTVGADTSRCHVVLDLARCGHCAGTRAGDSSKDGLVTIFSLDRVGRRSAFEDGVCTVGSACFSFVRSEVISHLRLFQSQHREKHVDPLRRTLELGFFKVAGPDSPPVWTLTEDMMAVPYSAAENRVSLLGRVALPVKTLKGEELLHLGLLSRSIRVGLLVLERLWRPDYRMEYACMPEEEEGSESRRPASTPKYVAEIVVREGEQWAAPRSLRDALPPRSSAGREVFRLCSSGVSPNEALQRVVLHTYVLAASYRQLKSEGSIYGQVGPDTMGQKEASGSVTQEVKAPAEDFTVVRADVEEVDDQTDLLLRIAVE